MRTGRLGPDGRHPGAVVTIPAHNEEEALGSCLSALAVQRTRSGSPLPVGAFEVLVLANNCSDATAGLAQAMAASLPYHLIVEECHLPERIAHAGGARRTVMDMAASRLRQHDRADGLILTTDADSRVAPTWLDANVAAIQAGVDGVAGFVDPDASEYIALGPDFVRRGRLEDTYLTALAEIDALFDPRPHDPWPNHRVASGASLAVTLDAYTTIGGLPTVAIGEDSALVRALERAGCRVRHSLDAVVTTSCRFEGRAPGGAADTMRLRHADPDAFCSDDLEPIMRALRRSREKGRLRQLHDRSSLFPVDAWAGSMGVGTATATRLSKDYANSPFAHLWEAVVSQSARFGLATPLRPSGLPVQIRRAHRLLSILRGGDLQVRKTAYRGDTPIAETPSEAAIA